MLANLALLILRVTVGAVFLAHGAQKAFGAFGGPGLAGTAGFLGTLGLRPATFWAVVAAVSELVAGALLVAGLFTPLAAVLVLGTMSVAIAKVHGPKGFFIQNGGFEYNLVLAVAAVVVALVGPGSWSLDRVLGL